MNAMNKFTDNPKLAAWLLRLGLVFVFAYAGIEGLRAPLEWIGYLPMFLTKHFDANTLLKTFSISELVLAAWLLSGKFLRYAALISALLLAGITLSNIPNFLITFRDVGLFAMALALTVLVQA